MRRRWFFIAPLAILGMALFVFLGGQLVKTLWNWLLPTLFGVGQVTFWQAVGLLGLCRILFGGVGMMPGRSGYGGHRHWTERWERLTPEERERMRSGLLGRPPENREA